MISKQKMLSLLEEAKAASQTAYAPYSGFPVGAAVLMDDESVYLGANVENASYGLTICAERVAICNAVTKGSKKIVAIAIFAKNADVTPCGACRQFIAEFGQDAEIIYSRGQEVVAMSIRDLLPDSFSGKELNR